MNITLLRHEHKFWVSQIDGSASATMRNLETNLEDAFWSLTKTNDELSLVSVIESHETFSKVEGPWALFQVEGVLDFGLTGILNALTKPLADAGISIFAISTFNTDYILVKTDVADQAQAVWQAAGFEVTGA